MSGGSPVIESGSPTLQNMREVLRRCREALAQRPSALITDVDGTISRIVANPDEATVDGAICRALEALASRLDLVAVITARDEGTARRMVPAAGVEFVTSYGVPAGGSVDGLAAVAAARAMVAAELPALPCVMLEDKELSFSLHYRNCEDPEQVRLSLLALVMPVATQTGVRVVEGKKVIELVPADLPDKRAAFRDLLDRAAIRGLVYLGDDLSDVPVFEEVRQRRRGDAIASVGIAVIDGETDEKVKAAADVWLQSVDEVGVLLSGLAREDEYGDAEGASGR